nr:hypothetical protein GCM10020092_024190 [Actinoplanes digitatis]
MPYTIWQRYGDLSVVDRNFAAMARYVDYLRSTAGADLIRNHETFGDWLNVDDNTANDVSSTAFFGWSARLLSRMAAATGRTAEAASYGTLADQIAAAFTGRFVAADGTVSGNSQTGYVLALAFGLVPANRTQAVADKLAAKVASRNGHLSVGFMGVENLLPVLAEYGHAATAYQILQQPDYPGWGYMNSRGATTIWERWDGIRTDGTLQDVGMNSFNHYGLGSVGDWLYRTVGGVGPAAPGYKQVLIAPKPGGTLTAATASLLTAYGQTRSEWTRARLGADAAGRGPAERHRDGTGAGLLGRGGDPAAGGGAAGLRERRRLLRPRLGQLHVHRSAEVPQLLLEQPGQADVPVSADRDASARAFGQHQHVEVYPVEREPGARGVIEDETGRGGVAPQERVLRLVLDAAPQRRGDEVQQGVAPQVAFAVDKPGQPAAGGQHVAVPEVEVQQRGPGDRSQVARVPGGQLAEARRQRHLPVGGVGQQGVEHRAERRSASRRRGPGRRCSRSAGR